MLSRGLFIEPRTHPSDQMLSFFLLSGHRQEQQAFRNDRREADEDEQRDDRDSDQVPPAERRHDGPGQQGFQASAEGPEEGHDHDGPASNRGRQELGVQRA